MYDILYWVGIGLSIVLAILVIIMIAGSFMPRNHKVSRSITLKQSQQAVWDTITDYAKIPEWHKEVVQTEQLEDRNGHPVWKETYKGNYSILLETTEEVKMKKLVRTIADVDGPFSGRWEFDMASSEDGCQLTITEYGAIPNPFFRFMARLFMNPAFYLEMYLQALAKKFQEEVVVQGK